MLKHVFIFLFLLSSFASIAQVTSLELEEKKKRELKNLGREAERNGRYYLAIEYYKKLVDYDTSNIKNQFHYAELLRYTRDYQLAEKHYAAVCNIDEKEYPLAMFYLATMQKANGKPEIATGNLEKFKKLMKAVDDKKFRKLYASELEGCHLAISLKDSLPHATLVSMGNEINNPHIDFSPIPLADEIVVFGSLRETEQKFYEIDENNDTLQLPTRKFYIADKEDNKWNFDGEWQGPFNSSDADIANGTYSLDKKRFYFTKCQQNWQFKVICKIYYSEQKDDNSWSEPVLLNEEINLPGYTSSHPTFGRESKKNNEVMYFVSDRKEKSKGGLDIWCVEYDAKKKKYKKVKNAGSAINSVGTEMTPFYDIKTRTLYFSSDGKPNMGGLDLYKASGELNKWDEPKHLGLPFNSSADDLDFSLKPSGKGGFIVSNRVGGQSVYNATCCDDIYEFAYVNFIDLVLTGSLIDVSAENPELLDTKGQVNVYITNGKDDRFLTETIPLSSANFKLNLKPGFDYEIEVNKEGYFNNSVNISTKNYTKSDNIVQSIRVEKVPQEPIVIPHINYGFDSDKLTDDSKLALDTSLVVLLKKNPTFKIEVMAHTDSKGSDAYNLKLSQKRAESVVKYLVSKGINAERLTGKGYGETKPVAPNSNPDGSDNPEGRQKNRRTEFKIIGNIDPDLIQYDNDEEE